MTSSVATPSDAELRGLLRDCLTVWEVTGTVRVEAGRVILAGLAGDFDIQRAPPDLRPVRWFLQTPERRQAGRPPRAVPSIVALLSALRNHLGGAGGDRLRIGASGAD